MKNESVTVITGATSGIGLATTKLLFQKGHVLALIARSQDNLLNIQKLLKEEGKVKIYQCDVSQSEGVKKTFEKIINDFSSIKNLVNCASLTHSKSIEQDTEEGFNEEVDINLKGTYLSIMAAYKHMSKNGAVVNFSSIRARTGAPSSSVGYAAAKAGIINLTKTFALQLAPLGIRVNCIAPGAIYPTGFTVKWTEEKRSAFIETVPLKRLGNPEEIAQVAEFLLSEKASYITGHTLDVNGGAWMN